MIPIEKSEPSEVEKICDELYKKMNFQDYPEFKNDLNKWVTDKIPGVGTKEDAFQKIMIGEYSLLENLKESLNNFILQEPKLTEYLKKSL